MKLKNNIQILVTCKVGAPTPVYKVKITNFINFINFFIQILNLKFVNLCIIVDSLIFLIQILNKTKEKAILQIL